MKSQNGFTLLEVAVALGLLVVGLAISMEIFSGGFKNLRRVDMAHRAMSHGENVMNEILTDGEIAGPAVFSDDLDEDFAYRAEVTDWEEPSEKLNIDVAPSNVRLLKIDLEIIFKNDRFGKQYRLSCLKAVALQGEAGEAIDPIQQLFNQRSR